jgi:tRNA pseudouridine55 synthase
MGNTTELRGLTFDFAAGEVLLVDKPLNWTSFNVVAKLKYRIKPAKKIGHAGTLDPLATGLLIICTGKKTKEIESYMGQIKEYTGVIQLGVITPSYDYETEPSEHRDYKHIQESEVLSAIENHFLGEIEQVPPVFSAIKVDGKRSYDLARKGEAQELKKRNVTVETFEITRFDFPNLHFRIVCSKGTYIRSLAHDLGQELGCGGVLAGLRRTKIGNFHVDDAWNLEELVNLLEERKEKASHENL